MCGNKKQLLFLVLALLAYSLGFAVQTMDERMFLDFEKSSFKWNSHEIVYIEFKGIPNKERGLLGAMLGTNHPNDNSYEVLAINAYYRCAEYAKKRGKKHFVMYRSLADAALDKPINKPIKYGDFQTTFAIVSLVDTPRFGSHDTDEVLIRYRDKVKIHKYQLF